MKWEWRSAEIMVVSTGAPTNNLHVPGVETGPDVIVQTVPPRLVRAIYDGDLEAENTSVEKSDIIEMFTIHAIKITGDDVAIQVVKKFRHVNEAAFAFYLGRVA